MLNMRAHIVGTVFVAAFAIACGGGSNPASSNPSPTAPSSPAATTLTIVSAETDQPIAGGTVSIASKQYTTNGVGQVSIDQAYGQSTVVDIVASGFLDRQTLARSDTLFSLWPRTSPTGLNESFVREAVYSSGLLQSDPANLGIGRLYRPGVKSFSVYTPPEVQADATAIDILRQATERLSAATGGQVVYALSTDSSAANTVRVTIDPSFDPVCAASPNCSYGGSDRLCDANGYIIGAAIIFDEVRTVRFGAIHELGHAFGLGHTTARGVMQGPNPANPQQSYSEPPLTDFTEQEKLVMKLMLQRPAMNRWPDNDRGITQISSCSNTTAPCVFRCPPKP